MKISLTKKFMILLIPLAIVTAVVGEITWLVFSGLVTDLGQEYHVIELALESQDAVGDMSDALKSVILNPADKAEAERKEAADELNSKIIEQLAKMVDDPETLKLIEAMGKFDEEQLNPAEDEAVRLAQSGKVQEAQAYYIGNYAPKRVLYNEMSDALLERVRNLVKAKIAETAGHARTPLWALILGNVLFSILMVVLVRRLSASLNETVKKLSSEASQLNTASQKISDSGNALSSAATEQAAALQETVTSIDEVSAMVTRNADNSKRSQEVANTSLESANRGQDTVNKMITSIDDISHSNQDIINHIEQSNRDLGNIVKVISEIGNKTRIINDIVFQTKLLSFNASVEAARAGEHGKGFAVVAEEVGNLAQMSGNAAKEISEMLEKSVLEVEKIVNDTRAKVDGLVATGKQRLEVGGENARACGAVLKDIVDHVTDLSRMVGEISTASQEQSIGVKEITKAMGQLDQVTQANASESREAANFSDQLKKQAAEMTLIVNGLVELVQGSQGEKPQAAPPAAPSGKVVPIAAAPKAAPKPQPKAPVKSEEKSAGAWKKAAGDELAVPSENDPRFEDI